MFSSNESYLRLENEPDNSKEAQDPTEVTSNLRKDPASSNPDGMEVTEIEVTAPPEKASVESPPILTRLSWETPDPPKMAPPPINSKGSWSEAISEQPIIEEEVDNTAVLKRKLMMVVACLFLLGLVAIIPLAIMVAKEGNGDDNGASAFSIGEEEDAIISGPAPSSNAGVPIALNPTNTPSPVEAASPVNGVPSPTALKPTFSPSALQVPANDNGLNPSNTPVPSEPVAAGGQDDTEAPTKVIGITPSPSDPTTNLPVPATDEAFSTPSDAPTMPVFTTPYVIASAAQAPSTPEPTSSVLTPNSQAPSSVQNQSQQNSEVPTPRPVFSTIVVASVPLWQEEDNSPSAKPSTSPIPSVEPAPFAPLWAKGTPSPTPEPTIPTTKPEEEFVLIGGSATLPTLAPTTSPTKKPTQQPTKRPTSDPTPAPTDFPTLPEYPEIPVQAESIVTAEPTQDPWTIITSDSPKPPTFRPTEQALLPELEIVTAETPTFEPTFDDTQEETEKPKNNKNDKDKDGTDAPTRSPTKRPTLSPTIKPGNPTRKPTNRPTPPTDEMTFVPGLLTHEENGLILSQGLTARIIAVESNRVPYDKDTGRGEESEHWFHGEPDAAAVFEDPSPDNPGGWIYVSNSEEEDNEGGVGAMVFDSEGRVIKYHRLLMGTSWNCGGGKTPWNTWISCEESGDGVIFQVDPTGQRMPEAITMGREGGSWESFAFDIRNREEPHFFVTEDDEEGALQRFTPTDFSWSNDNAMWNMLTGPGVTEYLLLEPSFNDETKGTFSWGQSKDEAKENAFRYYRHTEGIDIHEGIAYVVCKEDKWLFTLDLDAMTYTRHSTESGIFDGEPDQLKRILSTGGEEFLYFTEDGGQYAGIHGRDETGLFFTILESVVYDDETTGLAFSPDYRHMYIAYQDNGLLFDVTRQDGHPFSARALDVKYHQPTEENLNHAIWRRSSN